MHELAPWMLKYAGWELEVAAHWPIERALCIYHPRDEVINLRLSSLYLELHQRYGAQEMQSLQLSSTDRNTPHHMVSLSTSAREWDAVAAAITRLLDGHQRRTNG